ncbi:MAG: cell division protein FtsQ [Zetaproteobacteria bacterium]|nr:MAG: cell division protein FtsQ [Zetaproteobacteria bacterium]
MPPAKKKKAKQSKASGVSKGTRRSTLKKRKVKRFEHLYVWGRRVALTCLGLAFFAWVGVVFFLSDADTNAMNWIKGKTISIAGDAGYRVENIMVEGRKYSDPDVLLALINIAQGDSIFLFNPDEAKAQIEKIGWVKSARVERRLPDTIYIKLQERRPLALWQNGEALSLIDSEGTLLTQDNLGRFKDLLMIRGKGAPEKAQELLSLLAAEQALESLLDHADLVDGRRWDLYLNDGKRIKLPENDIGLAMRNMMLRHEQDNILGKDSITVIDARYQGRLIIRTKLGKVQDYKAGLIDASASL